ncbi:MAG: integration host factor subunit beta [Syntrophales bacterium]|nr:integration host factor subunit beta [Syntrophales bacterium]
MTKHDIVQRIAVETGLQQADVKRIVQMVLDGMIDCLASEGNLELRNFGIFKIRTRRPRKARNPRTGESVMLPERKAVAFRPGKIMEAKVCGAVPPPAQPAP